MEQIGRILTAPTRWLRKLYDWTIHWSKTPSAPWALFCIAFVESSFFPIPPDVLLIAMTAGDRKRWWKFALICTAGSVAGAFLGYFIGMALFESIGKWIVEAYHLQDHVSTVGKMYADNAFLAVFTAAFTPIPYKVFTIAAGLFQISLAVLFIASVFGRGGRFFLVAGLLRIFGEKVTGFIEKYFDIVSIVFVVLLVGGFVLIKHLVH